MGKAALYNRALTDHTSCICMILLISVQKLIEEEDIRQFQQIPHQKEPTLVAHFYGTCIIFNDVTSLT